MKLSKKCRCPCGVVKPLSEFHKNGASVDGHQVYCKICHRARVEKAKRHKSRRPWSTRFAKLVLAAHGIYAEPTGDYVDLSAWGCIPIEAKAAKPAGGDPRKFRWVFSPKQRQNGFDGFVLLVARVSEDELRVFVVPGRDDFLMSRGIGDGQRKYGALTVTFDSRQHGPTKGTNEPELLPFEDAFHLIEQERQKIADRLSSEAA